MEVVLITAEGSISKLTRNAGGSCSQFTLQIPRSNADVYRAPLPGDDRYEKEPLCGLL